MKSSDIINIREKLDLTQGELAEKIDVSVKTVSRWETGKTAKIPEKAQQKLSELLQRGGALIYTQEASLFLQSQSIRFGTMSPWLLLPHIATASLSAQETFVNRGVKPYSKLSLDLAKSGDSFDLESLPDLATKDTVILLGEAGSGKTFLLRWIAEKQGDCLHQKKPCIFGKKIPIIFPLIQYNEPPSPEKIKEYGHPLLAAIAEFHNYYGNLLEPSFLCEACKKGEVIFLLDALDEIPSENRRHQILMDIETCILKYNRCSFILTSRPDKYRQIITSTLRNLNNRYICELEPLTLNEQQTLIERLYESIQKYQDEGNIGLQADSKRCIEFVQAFQRKNYGKNFLSNPLHLVLAALLILEGRQLPETTDVHLEQQSLELNIIRWPEARSLGQSVSSTVNFPGTDISKNQIWSKLSKWALEIIESEQPIHVSEIERWVLSIPIEPDGETVESNAQRITNLMLERLPFIMRLEGKDKFTIYEPHLTHLAAHRLTELRMQFSLSKWLFRDGSYKVWKRVEVWKRAVLITSTIHRQPELVKQDLRDFVKNYSPDELDNLFDTAESMSSVIQDLINRPGVLDWEPKKDFYEFLMRIYFQTDFDATAKFLFRIFRYLQQPDDHEPSSQKLNRTLLKDVCRRLISNKEDYENRWRSNTLLYAIQELSGGEAERNLCELLLDLEEKSKKATRNSNLWQELEVYKRRVIFSFLLLQWQFSERIDSHSLSYDTIDILLKILDEKDSYEPGVAGRVCDVLDAVKDAEYLSDSIENEIRNRLINVDSSVLSLSVVENFETSIKEGTLTLEPRELIDELLIEIKNKIHNIYTSEPVKRLSRFLLDAGNSYSEAGQMKEVEFSKILFLHSMNLESPPIIRAASFLYLAELPQEIVAQIPDFLSRLEDCLKRKPRPEQDNISVGAVQIYDYNQICLNKRYSYQARANMGNNAVLEDIGEMSYISSK